MAMNLQCGWRMQLDACLHGRCIMQRLSITRASECELVPVGRRFSGGMPPVIVIGCVSFTDGSAVSWTVTPIQVLISGCSCGNASEWLLSRV
jgi:hypothetical protein